MLQLLRSVKIFLKQQAPRLGSLVGKRLLTKQQTTASLAHWAQVVMHDPGEMVTLPSFTSALFAPQGKLLFHHETLQTAASFVWRLTAKNEQLRQLPNGSLQVGGNVLDLDFGNGVVLTDFVKRTPRQPLAARILIAPWSHYWTGYFDYLFYIALKLYRIKRQLSPAEFAQAVVCYPLYHTSFEREVLAFLGVQPTSVVDSRHTRVEFESCLLGNNDSWFYPNKQDVLAFNSLVQGVLKEKEPANKRIYIQRTGRRQVVNEAALVVALESLGFTIVADVPRTFLEQLELYYNAAFIIGPHGASFANIIACRAGTQLVELFADTYVPGYFRYVAHLLELNYTPYCAGPSKGSDHRHVADDVVVDVTEVVKQVSSLLGAQAS